MFPHHKSSGRRTESIAQHHHNIQQQVEVHNFGKQSNFINNNNNSSSSRKSSGYSSSLCHHHNGKTPKNMESQFDSSHFLKSSSLTRADDDDDDVKPYGRNFNLHFPELVTGCSPTFDERPSSSTPTPIHDSRNASSHQIKLNDKIELQPFDVSPRRHSGESEVKNSHQFDERKTSNFIQKRPGFPQVSWLKIVSVFIPYLLFELSIFSEDSIANETTLGQRRASATTLQRRTRQY